MQGNEFEGREQVEELIDNEIAQRLRVDKGEFDDKSRFLDEPLEAESIDIIEMAEMLDMELGVFIPDEDLEDMGTVGDVKKYVINAMDLEH